jgi:hypothetical protein
MQSLADMVRVLHRNSTKIQKQTTTGMIVLAITILPIMGTVAKASAKAPVISSAQVVSDAQWLNKVGCDPSGSLCMVSGTHTGPNALTPGYPVIAVDSNYGIGTLMDTQGFYITAISCPNSTNCIAIGNNNAYSLSGNYTPGYVDLTVHNGLVDGATYTNNVAGITGVQAFFDIFNGSPTDMTCVSSTQCIALIDDLTIGSFAIVNFDPTTGDYLQPVQFATNFTTLDHIACSSASSCLITGADPNNTAGSLVATYDPSSGTFGNPLSNANQITALACQSTATCYALERNSTGAVLEQPLAVATGLGGTTYPLAYGGPGQGGFYISIACAAFNPCLAVGGLNPNPSVYTTNTKPLSDEIVNGVPTAASIDPSQLGSDNFGAVTCPLANSCQAVGTTAYQGGPGHQTYGMAVNLSIAGQESGYTPVNYADGGTCPPDGAPDGGVPGGSRFNAVQDKSSTTVYGVSAHIGAANDCYDAGFLYPSSWVMLENPGQSNDTFVQAGIAYHHQGRPDMPFVELSPNYWTSSNASYPIPSADGILDDGSSLEFPRFSNTTNATFSVKFDGLKSSKQWCSWVPLDVRNHSELEGSPPGLFSQSYEYEMDMNGSCLWYFYMPSSALQPNNANVATETHSYYQHAPGTITNPLVFSSIQVEPSLGGNWKDFVNNNPKKDPYTQQYYCSTDAGQGVGKGNGYTFSVWGTSVPDRSLEPSNCSF